MKMHIVKFADPGPDEIDGGSIFDRRLIHALVRQGVDVTVEDVPRRRKLTVPMWRSAIRSEVIDRVREAGASGRSIVVSHEGLFDVALATPVDALIVHNHFGHFAFRGHPIMERYYRAGSRRYYRKVFGSAKCAFFISHREQRLAIADYPQLRGRTDICVPPPRSLPRADRSDHILHMSGNDKWWPKRKCRLTDQELDRLTSAGYRIADLDPPVEPASAIINDRFEIGFKLKLTQMLEARDVIATFCDLSEEIDALCPAHPFYRQVKTVEQAIAFFQEVSEAYTKTQIDKHYARLEASGYLPTWDKLATQLLALIAKHVGTDKNKG